MSDQPLTLFTYSRSGSNEEDRWAYTGIPDIFFEDFDTARRSVIELRNDVTKDSADDWPTINIEKVEIGPLTKTAVLALLNDGIGAIVRSREIVETIGLERRAN